VRPWSLALVAVLLVGCGHAAKLRPTPLGQVAVEAEVGGPFAKVGKDLYVLPLSTLGASWGVAQGVDVSAHLHPSAALLGVGGLDLGASWQPLLQRGAVPAVTLTGRLYGFTDFQTGFAPYLELGVAGSYQVAGRLSPYLDVSALVQTDAWPLLAAGAGLELELGRATLQAEFRWFGPNRSTRFNVVHWESIGGFGAYGVLLGVHVRLGGAQ